MNGIIKSFCIKYVEVIDDIPLLLNDLKLRNSDYSLLK